MLDRFCKQMEDADQNSDAPARVALEVTSGSNGFHVGSTLRIGARRRDAILIVALGALYLLTLTVSTAAAVPPEVIKSSFSHVGSSSAKLEAEINPKGNETIYRFEYGRENCESGPCVSTPGNELDASSVPELVHAEIEGLTPGATYHFRVLAESADGKVEGPDDVFTSHVVGIDGLPDGRAYEQSSPVKKNAAGARGRVAWVKAAVTGGAVSFLGTSGIPGGKGAQELPVYLSSRMSTQWSTQGLLPPAGTSSEAFVLGWLPDFSEVFDFATAFGGGHDGTLLARSSIDGSLTPIVTHGSGLSNSLDTISYAGASINGSRVLFESRDKLLSGAIPGKSNVYLWDRSSEELSLAGVLNDGSAPAAGAFAGPYDWIQDAEPKIPSAGGSSDDYYTQDQHAISTDGDSVYFTAAGSGELYVRKNPTKEQSPLDGNDKCINSALACTLNLSASQRGVPDPLGPRPAAFMAGTPDGSTAFFTSPEMLTDAANTGPEQPAPAVGRADIDGESIENNFLPVTASGIAVGGEYIYWINTTGNTIGRAKLDGSGPEPNFITVPEIEIAPGELVPASPQYVAVDTGHVYWTNTAGGSDGEGTIGRASVDGTPASIEVAFIKGASRPKGIAVNATHIFWANAGSDGSTRTIARAEIDGNSASIEQGFIPLGGLEMPEGVALNDTHLYWTTNNPSSFIVRSDLDGQNQIFQIDTFEEAPGKKVPSDARGIAVSNAHVYWARQRASEIGRANVDLEELEPEFIDAEGRLKGLAIDADRLYWSSNGDAVPNPGNDLYRYEVGSEALTDLTPDSTDVNGAEVKGVLGVSDDGSYVYFAANGDLDGTGPATKGNCRGEAGSSLSFSGECSLYILHQTSPSTRTVNFIARLNANGAARGSDAVNWLPHGSPALLEKAARVSSDGLTLLFSSQQQLTLYDNEGAPELYRYRVGEAGPSCVSCNPTGATPIFSPTLGDIDLSAVIPVDPAFVLSRNLSSDGKRVFFESSDALVAADTNGEEGCPRVGSFIYKFPACQDVYEWEAEGTGSCKEDVQGGGCLYLLSTGKSHAPSFFGDASKSGEDAFILTRSAGLVRQDQDQLQDVYDARIGGGLGSQNEVHPPECEGADACGGPSSAPPDFQSPVNANHSGPGNKKQAHRPAKKHRKHKKHKHKRTAHKTGRGSR